MPATKREHPRPAGLRERGRDYRGNPIFAVQKILASRRVGTGHRGFRAGSAHLIQDGPSIDRCRPCCDRHKTRNGLAVASDYDLISGFGAANQPGQLSLGIADGNQHVLLLPGHNQIWTMAGSISNLTRCVTI